MANHVSAEKRARSNERKRVRNRTYNSMVKSAVKRFRDAAEQVSNGAPNELGSAETLFRHAQAMLQKASTKGVIHANNAARHISRLNAVLKKAQAGTKAK